MEHAVNSVWRRFSLLSLAIGLAAVSINAQGRGTGSAIADPVRQVRTALAHGDVSEARRLAANIAATNTAVRDTALAAIDIFEGKYAEARARLVPIADRAPLGEAAVELGLLDLRTGRRQDAQRRLDPIASNRNLPTPDDYFRLMRAARGTREFLLANDAYLKVIDAGRPDIHTEAGDQFLERHRADLALASYNDALKADPRWLPALIGVARSLSDENPAQAKKALDAVREVSADYPDLALVTAEQKLEGEDVTAAVEALDQLARVRPGTIDEAALRVAVAYKTSGIGAIESAIERVRAIDPSSPLGYRLASEQAARDYRFDESAALARQALQIDQYDAPSQFDLGLALMRTGDEPAARTALLTAWDLDNSSALTKNLLDLLDKIDGFEIVSHNDFIFKFSKQEAPVLKIYALPLADEAYAQFKVRYGLTPKGPLLVEVFPIHDDFAVRTFGLPGLVGALGACFGRVVTMDSPRARPPGDFSWQATLWHELAHVFTLQSSDYRVPRWLTEGVSVYEEHRRQPAWGRELTLQFARQYSKGQNFGVKKLPDAFKRPETLSLAYFEASLLVEHLVALNGDAGLRTLLQAYASGDKDAEAFAKAFGRSVDQVEASFAAFGDHRYADLKVAMADPPQQVAPDDVNALRARAATAPNNFLSQLALGQALVAAGDLAGAKAPLERAASLAPQAMGTNSPRALLSTIVEKDNPTEARRLLRELLTYDHTNIVAARRLAALAAPAGATDQEDYALRLIADLDPFDAAVHSKLGTRLMAKNEVPAALIEFQAVVALGPTNMAEAQANVADAYLKLGRPADARRAAMLALREAPSYERAQDILLAATGGN